MTETSEFAKLWADLLESSAVREMLQDSLAETRISEKVSLSSSDRIQILGQRILLELLAARVLQSRERVELDEALDRLSQELDVSCLAIDPKYELLKQKLSAILTDLDLTKQTAIDLFEERAQAKDPRWAGYPPTWLAEPLVSLAIPEKPVLFLNCSNSTLIPHFLLDWARSKEEEAEFVTLDRDPDVVETLRLLASLAVSDLKRVRESVLHYVEDDPRFEDWGFSQLSLFDTFESGRASPDLYNIISSELRPDRFGSAIVCLQGPAFQGPRYYAELSRGLPAALSQVLTIDGRAIIMGLPSILYGTAWSKFRANSQEHLHLESIIDLSNLRVISGGRRLPSPTLILLRQPQYAITRQVTAFAPAEADVRAPEPHEFLAEIIEYLNKDIQIPEAIAFERPTSELGDRWDPKFYCPARRRLQDELISSPQTVWLGSVTQLIERGPPLFVLKPYITTRIAGVTFEGRQETIAHLKVGDQIWLYREIDNPHDPNAIHVKRRSGASLGYLPAELAAEVAEAIDELDGRHQATVIEIRGRTSDHPDLGITIEFAPPECAQKGEPVSVVRPRDIMNNRLTGKGEKAWLLSEQQKRVTRLQAGDILLSLRGLGRACVVPREFEGDVCHRDLAIIRPNEDVDPLYLLAFMVSSEFQEQLGFVARGVTIPAIDLQDLHELLVIIPSLPSQRRLALAFAESQGELGPGLKENIGRWLDLTPSDVTVEQQWIYSSVLSSLFSDWDQIHSLDDWLRLKSKFVHDLRGSFADRTTPFADAGIDASFAALDTLTHLIEQGRRDPENWVSAMHRAGQMLAEFREHVERIENPSLRSRLSSLATKLAELLEVQAAVPASLELHLEPTVVPAGIPVLVHLTVTNQDDRPIGQLEITPYLLNGKIIARSRWHLQKLAPGEMHSFEARMQFDRSETVTIRCDISFLPADGDLAQLTTQVTAEVVPAEHIPFVPIQPNPYITGGAVDAPEMFFGRQDVLDLLSTNLIGKHQSNVIILQGNRRTGKSSILKQVVNRDLFAPHIPVYVDCQGLGQLTDQKFFFKLAREIWKVLIRRDDVDTLQQVRRADISKDDPFYDFQDVLDQLVAAIPGRRIILLLDEFEIIDMAIQRGELNAIVLENLRHLFQHRQDLAVVLTGSYRLTQLGREYWSILFGLGLRHEIGFLDENAAQQLITRPLRDVVTYSAEGIERIVQLTACQPYFVQVLCHNVVNILNRHETTYVTQSHVEEAAQETLVSADGHMSFMFKLASTRTRQAILVYMASSLSRPDSLASHEIEQFVTGYRLPMSRAELEQALRELSDRDIVRIEGTMGQRQYGFKIDLFRQWIRRRYDLQSAIALAQSASYVREE